MLNELCFSEFNYTRKRKNDERVFLEPIWVAYMLNNKGIEEGVVLLSMNFNAFKIRNSVFWIKGLDLGLSFPLP